MVEAMSREWHDRGMPRIRISTTVDAELLTAARAGGTGGPAGTDAELIDAALSALLANRRAGEIDRAYEGAYERHPLDEPDEWGDLESFRNAAGAS